MDTSLMDRQGIHPSESAGPHFRTGAQPTQIPAMKLLSAVLGLACLALGTQADLSFKPPLNNSTLVADTPFKRIKTAVNFSTTAAKMNICPGGDCIAGQAINLALSRLEEVNINGTAVVTTNNFNQSNGLWTDFMQTQSNNVSVRSTTYATRLKVNGTVTTVSFALTASIYAVNGTTMNGNQSLAVPAGGLKSTLMVSGWKFKNVTNKLRLAMAIKVKGRGMNPAPLKSRFMLKSGVETSVRRIEWEEGIFVDAPTNAVLDGVDKNITFDIWTYGDSIEIVWVFPSFKQTLHYDSVASSDNTTFVITPAPTTKTPTTQAPTPTTKTPTTKNLTTTTTIPSWGSAASSASAATSFLFASLAAIAAYAFC